LLTGACGSPKLRLDKGFPTGRRRERMERLEARRPDGTLSTALAGGEGGEPLVLLHGFPFAPAMWEPQLRDLRREARLLAPALLGLGTGRLARGAAPGMDDYADDVLAWMDETGIHRAVVAGLSMGGYVAFALRRRAPERIAALALIDTKPEADGEETRRGRVATREAIAKGGMAAVAGGMLGNVLGATTHRTRPDVVERVRRMILDTDPAGAMAAVDALRERPDSVATLATIDVPVTVVVGEEDTLTPPDVARAMAGRIAGARLVVVPGAGHVTSLEAPEAVTRVLRELLLARR